MNKLRILVLCGRSPRHLYVANALCEAADVLAIVQETGGEWSARKVLKKLAAEELLSQAMALGQGSQTLYRQ